MRIRALLFLIAALIVGACTTTEAELARADWCYTWDFVERMGGWTFFNPEETPNPLEPTRGEHIEDTGVTTSSWGRLWMQFNYAIPIDINAVSAKIVKPEEVTEPFSLEYQLNVFGATWNGILDWPAEMPEVNLALRKETLSSGYKRATVILNSEQPVIVESITVYGSGNNPFPVNYCPDGTLTPPPTNTPTHTPSPTPTLTPEFTLTPSGTPIYDTWTCEFDFTLTDGGWTTYTNFGQSTSSNYVSGQGWKSNSGTSVMSIQFTFPTMAIITGMSATFTFNYTAAPNSAFLKAEDATSVYNGTTTGGVNYGLPGLSSSLSPQTRYVTISNDDARRVLFYLNYTGSTIGATVTDFAISGLGDFSDYITESTGVDCTPGVLNTPTPTITLTSSNTPTTTNTATATSTLGTPTPSPTRTTIPSVTPPAPSKTSIPLPPTSPATTTPDPSASTTPYQFEGETNDAGGAGTGLGAVMDGLGNIVGNWGQSASDMLGGMIEGFTNAPPEAIPGLPRCMTEPLEHDWCAIIYIIEYTIIAPGSVGELLIPVLQIMLYTFLTTYLVRGVLWVIRRAEEVTYVD